MVYNLKNLKYAQEISKEVALKMVQTHPEVYNSLPINLKTDLEIARLALKRRPELYRELPPEVNNDPEIINSIKEYASDNPSYIEFKKLPEALKHDKSFIRMVLVSNFENFNNLPEELQQDPEIQNLTKRIILKHARENRGYSLNSIPELFRHDKEIVFASLGNGENDDYFSENLAYIPEEFHNDPQIHALVLEQAFDDYSIGNIIRSGFFNNDKQTLFKLVKRQPLSFQYLSEEYKGDPDFTNILLQEWPKIPQIYEIFPYELQQNKEIAKQAITLSLHNYDKLPENFREDPEFYALGRKIIFDLISKKEITYYNKSIIPIAFRNDEEIYKTIENMDDFSLKNTNDKENIIRRLSHNSALYKTLSDEMKRDPDVIQLILKRNLENFSNIPDDIKPQYYNTVKELIYNNLPGYPTFRYIPQEFQTDREVALFYCKKAIENFNFLPAEFQEDPEFFNQVKQEILNGSVKYYHTLPSVFKQDRDIVRYFLTSDETKIKQMPVDIQLDPEFKPLTINYYKTVPHQIHDVHKELLKDKDIILAILSHYPSNYNILPEEMKNNYEIALLSLKGAPSVYKSLPEEFKLLPEFYEIEKEYLKRESVFLNALPKEFIHDKEVLQTWVNADGLHYQYLPNDEKEDKYLAEIAFSKNKNAYAFMPDNLRADPFFTSKLLPEEKTFYYSYLPEELKQDIQIAKGAFELSYSNAKKMPEEVLRNKEFYEFFKEKIADQRSPYYNEIPEIYKHDVGIALEFIEKNVTNINNFPEELQNNLEILTKAKELLLASENSFIFQYGNIKNNTLKKDLDIIRRALKFDGTQIHFVPEGIFQNEQLVTELGIIALNNNRSAYDSFPDIMKKNKQLAVYSLEKSYLSYYLFLPEIREDYEISKKAIEKNGELFSSLPDKFKKDPFFYETAKKDIINHETSFYDIPDEFQSDEDILIRAIKKGNISFDSIPRIQMLNENIIRTCFEYNPVSTLYGITENTAKSMAYPVYEKFRNIVLNKYPQEIMEKINQGKIVPENILFFFLDSELINIGKGQKARLAKNYTEEFMANYDQQSNIKSEQIKKALGNTLYAWVQTKVFTDRITPHDAIEPFYNQSVINQPKLGQFIQNNIGTNAEEMKKLLSYRASMLEDKKIHPGETQIIRDQNGSILVYPDNAKGLKEYQYSRNAPNVPEHLKEFAKNLKNYGHQNREIINALNELKISDEQHIQANKVKIGKFEFEILKKNDPLGIVLGDITSCCQIINGVSESAVFDGYANSDSGFLAVRDNKNNIVAQSYIRRGLKTNTLYLDNIETSSLYDENYNNEAKNISNVEMLVKSTTLADYYVNSGQVKNQEDNGARSSKQDQLRQAFVIWARYMRRYFKYSAIIVGGGYLDIRFPGKEYGLDAPLEEEFTEIGYTDLKNESGNYKIAFNLHKLKIFQKYAALNDDLSNILKNNWYRQNAVDLVNKYFPDDYIIDEEDLLDEMGQTGAYGIGLIDEQENKLNGHIYGYNLIWDEDIDDYDLQGIQCYSQECSELYFKQKIKQLAKDGKIFYVSYLVLEKTKRLKLYDMLVNLLNNLRAKGYPYVAFDALPDTYNLFFNQDNSIKTKNIIKFNIELSAVIPDGAREGIFLIKLL